MTTQTTKLNAISLLISYAAYLPAAEGKEECVFVNSRTEGGLIKAKLCGEDMKRLPEDVLKACKAAQELASKGQIGKNQVSFERLTTPRFVTLPEGWTLGSRIATMQEDGTTRLTQWANPPRTEDQEDRDDALTPSEIEDLVAQGKALLEKQKA